MRSRTSTSAQASNHTLTRIETTFDENNLVPNAGLVAPAALAQKLGLAELIHQRVILPADAVGRAASGAKAMTVIGAMLAGGDSIDDVNIMRGLPVLAENERAFDQARYDSAASVIMALRSLVHEHDAHVCATTHVTRHHLAPVDKRSILTDLAESAYLAYIPDLVMILYRDEMYNQESLQKGIAEVIVTKQRGGDMRTVRLAFLAHAAKFANLARPRAQP